MENEIQDKELLELESLITDGINTKIPITITFPLANGDVKEFGAMIRPLTNYEWNNAVRLSMNAHNKTTSEIEIVKMALYTKNGDEFPNSLITQFPTGIISTISKEIARVSGVKMNSEENIELMQKMMGF